jgi:methionyl aminopeptidase
MPTDQEYDYILEAGKIAGKARDFGKKLIKVDARVEEVTDQVENFIHEQEADMAFPAQISLNHVAAHYCAFKDDPLLFQKGDVVKLDVGVHVHGFIGDTATSVDLGGNEKLVEASREALNNALKMLKVGVTNGEVGKTIEKTIKGYGYVPVNNLSGHGLGRYKVHTSPSMPNFGSGDRFKIEDGMHFAIEPFASTGAGYVIEGHDAEIFAIEKWKPARSPITRNIMTEIKKYNDLPFCSRWLANKFGVPRTNFALREMLNQDIIRMYPPLSDKANGMVSQAEHSVFVDGEKIIVTTK